MSLFQFLRILWARRVIVLIATLAALLASLLVIKILPTRYEATSRVMLDLVKPDPISGEVISSGFARGYVKTQAELIKDYRVAGRVVDQLGWTSSPLYLAAYQNRAEGDNRDFRRWVAQTVINGTEVGLLDASNIMEISYRSSSAESARVIADAIREAYIDQTLAFKREAASRSAQWFRQQAQELRVQLTAAEARQNAFERETGIMVAADNSELEEVRLRALAATSAAPAISAAAMPVAPSPSQTQVDQINAQIAVVSRTLGPNHPQIIALQQQRNVLSQSAAREMAAARAAAAPGATGPSPEAQFQSQRAKVMAQRGKAGEAQRLAADVAVLRDQTNKTAARAAELQQLAASTETGITLLGSAVAPSDPIFPKIPMIIGGAIGLGLVLGILVSLLIELLSRRVRGADDLASSGVPVIGVMAREVRGRPDTKRLASRFRLTGPRAESGYA